MAEIAALGDVNPAVQKRLLEELRQSDPALWPLLTQQIRATLAYQQQRAGKTAEHSAATPGAMTPASVAEGNTSGAPPAHLPVAPIQPAAAGAPEQVAATPAAPAGASELKASAKESAAATANQAVDSPIKQVSYEEPIAPGDYDSQLSEAIKALEVQTREPSQAPEAVARQAKLRMLYLVAGRRDDALRPISGASTAQQEYWSKQLYALSTYLDSQRISDDGRRAAETVSHLTHAAASLSELGPLVVKNLSFCTEVSSYGVYKRTDHNEFKPGQQILLYAEVEHFKSEETREGFHTALQSSYQILDSQGRRVAHDDFALTEEHCQNRRRDYFVRYFLTLPTQIYEGQYTLELTVEDTLGRKIGQSTIQFGVPNKAK